MEYSQAYKDFQTSCKDSNGFILDPPTLETTLVSCLDYKVKYEVFRHVRNNLGSYEFIEKDLYINIEEGEITNLELGESYDPQQYLIDEVIEKISLQNENLDKDKIQESKHEGFIPRYKYKLKVREFIPVHEIEAFNSEEELFQKWPQFKPENKYEFFQPNGSFSVSNAEDKFLWKNINGRYYLDEETFNRIPSGCLFTKRECGYTDLILTAEAIKHRAYKLLSCEGYKFLGYFLRDFPDSKARHEKAIWDSHTSLYAKEKEMNHLELIRFRLIPRNVEEDNKPE